MTNVIQFQTLRAQRAYNELRKMGFGAAYSRSVVETLENARSNWENFGTVQGLLRGDGEKTKAWLKEQRYA